MTNTYSGFYQKLTVFILLISLSPVLSIAQVGNVIWEENFDDLNNWIFETGNGSWGWGNGELEFYQQQNVTIDPIPGEPGNNALHIRAKQESGPGITDQWGNPLNYTSGRVNTKSKISVKYGLIEVRVRVPDLDLGGWPAVWMLGTSNLGWPRSGEMDLLEMGHNKPFRDLHDTHNGGNGLNNSTVNQMAGANAIYYTDAAVNPQNPSGAASTSYDPSDVSVRPYYNYTNPLNDRFLIYRLYWDQDSLRFTVVDGSNEYDLYENPFYIDSESDEFQQPFYFIANLAIGGAFTDAYNLGDPGSGLPVSMPFPADMYVDYIRVSEWNGQGEVHIGPPTAQSGTFGIYTDNTPTNDKLTPGVNANIFVWEGTLTDGTIPPYEGSNGITWTTTGKGWFGAGILSNQPVNLFDFGAGNLKFRIKIPANVTFKIGVIDAWGNQNYVSFPAFQTTYGLVRDGNWGQACIPVSDIRGTLIDLRMMSYEFVILEENGTQCTFGLDDIYWEDGLPSCDTVWVTNHKTKSAKLNWNADAGATGYEIEGGELGMSSVMISTGSATSLTASGLTEGKGYYWRVRGTAGPTAGEWSCWDTFYTCSSPTALSVSNTLNNSAQLDYIPGNHNTTFTIAGRPNPGGPSTIVTVNNGANNSYSASGLAACQEYIWTVYAGCTGGGSTGIATPSTFSTSGCPSKSSIRENTQRLSIDVIPNPATDKVSLLVYNSSVEEEMIIKVYAMDGKQILATNAKLLSGVNNIELNTSEFAKGVYQVILSSGVDVSVKKLIIAR